MIYPKNVSNSTVSFVRKGNTLSLPLVTVECLYVFMYESLLPNNTHLPRLNSTMHDVVIPSDGIESAIDCLPTNSATRPVGVCSKLLKLSKPAIREILAAIYQQFIHTECVPNDW